MFQNPTLTQQMNDSKLADMRRETRPRRRTATTRVPARRFPRPLGRLIGH